MIHNVIIVSIHSQWLLVNDPHMSLWNNALTTETTGMAGGKPHYSPFKLERIQID